MRQFKIREAFTLLELLVVIGIIAILISLGAVSYSTAQKKARDAKRKSDLQTIQNCLEQYYSYNNNYKYPSNVTDGNLPSPLSCGSTTITTPTDPLKGTAYIASGTDATNYTTYTICPPEVRTGYLLETEDSCTTSGKQCCISNKQ